MPRRWLITGLLLFLAVGCGDDGAETCTQECNNGLVLKVCGDLPLYFTAFVRQVKEPGQPVETRFVPGQLMACFEHNFIRFDADTVVAGIFWEEDSISVKDVPVYEKREVPRGGPSCYQAVIEIDI